MPEKPTKVLHTSSAHRGIQDFLSRHDPKIVIVSGQASGTQFPLAREQQTLGRGPGVDLVFDEASMSRRHASIEFAGDGFRIRDLGSTNGVAVNGHPVQAVDLQHGDRIEMGELVLQVLYDVRQETEEAYELPAED